MGRNPNDLVREWEIRLKDMIHHLREDSRKVDEPHAQALFETAAEVLTGVVTACRHYQEKKEIFLTDEDEEEVGAVTDGAPD
ncbi:MAG: hypothetical protein HY592_00385 [Candidatus Omnitrophica bacterium]|nr:hypothetical protein [Candidatus Omnitrophota bacterium]